MTPDMSATPDLADHSVNGWSGEYVDSMYQQWLTDPDSVTPDWQRFFQGFELGYRPSITSETVEAGAAASAVDTEALTKQSKVEQLIYEYRDIGHFAADLDPLGTRRPFPEDLTLASFGLTEAD